MTSDHHSLQGAGQQHSPAPLSSVTCPVTREQCSEPHCLDGKCMGVPLAPDERIERATDSLMGELREARFRVVEQRMRGNQLERQLAAAVESLNTWKRWAIFNGVGLGLMIWAWVVGK